MTSPFEVLLVEPDATEAEVEQAYRQRVKETHPDQGGSVAEFRAVRAAYEEIVSDRAGAFGDASGAADGGLARNGDGEDRPADATPETVVEYLDYEALADLGWDVDDEDLFERAADAGLDAPDYGRFEMDRGDAVLEAAEACGFSWPFACRGGACANCAVKVIEGEMSTPVDHVLPPEMLDRGIRLSCNGRPETDELRLVYNVKHLPDLDDLRLPPRPFENAQVEG